MSKKEHGKTVEPKVVTRELVVRNQYGIHARPAALFVRTAGRFVSDIEVEKDGQVVSAKSIMGLLTLEARQGTVLTIRARGPDAREAVAALAELMERKFYED